MTCPFFEGKSYNIKKKMKNKLFFYPLFVLLCYTVLMSCDNSQNYEGTTPNIDLIDVNPDELTVENSIRYSSFFSGINLIPLETKKECLIGRIDELKIVNDTIYVLDSRIAKSLFLFNIDGQFIRKIGNTGKGPGEYVSPMSFTVDMDNRQIQLLDMKKILFFTLDGEFIREIGLKNKNMALKINYLNDLTYISYNVVQEDESDCMLVAVDKSGKQVKQWIPKHLYSKGFDLPVGSVNQFVSSDSGLRFMRTLMDTIFTISDDHTVSPYIHISSENMVNKNDIKEFNSYLSSPEDMAKITESKKFLGAANYAENMNLIMFNFQDNGFTRTVFYTKKDKKIWFTEKRVIDDLTNVPTYRGFYSTYKDYFVYAMDQSFRQLNQLIDNAKNGMTELSEEDQVKIGNLTDNSNPVVVLYKCR